MMRARTGKAVTDMATPMKRSKAISETSVQLFETAVVFELLDVHVWPLYLPYRDGAKTKPPIRKGTTTEIPPISIAAFELRARPGTSTSRPTTNMKIIKPS
jgi:hypothetical protein